MPGDHHGAERKKEEDVDELRTLSELREWYDKKDSELVETRMAPSASIDDMQSAQLPKSEGTKRKLVERFPALKLVIKEWNQCRRFALEAAWAGDDDVVWNDVARHTFDHILKRRRSDLEQAGMHNALPDKVSKWWFHKMKAEMGLKYTVVGRELFHGMLKE